LLLGLDTTAEVPDGAGSNSTPPDLRVGISLSRSEAGGQIVRIDFISSGFDVDHDEFHGMATLEVRTHCFLKNRLAAFGISSFG
jgi:hypothetical protein